MHASPTETSVVETFDYAFNYRAVVRPLKGAGSRSGAYAELVARTTGGIFKASAPPDYVGSLAVPAAGGRDAAPYIVDSGIRIRLANVDGVLMRTLCRPGSKAPCDVETFVRAAKGDIPWLDSPFTMLCEYPWNERRYCPIAERNLPSTEFVEMDGQGYKCRESCDVEVTARLASLRIADGLVWTPCEMPVLTICMVRPRGGSWSFEAAWNLKEFNAFSLDNGTIYGRDEDKTSFGILAFATPPEKITYGVGRHADALKMATALSKTVKPGNLLKGLRRAKVLPPTWTDPVDVEEMGKEDVRRKLFEDVADSARFRSPTYLPESTRKLIEAARKAPEDEDAMTKAMDAFASSLQRDLKSDLHMALIAIRWDATERSFEPASTEDDVAALVGF